MTKKDYELIAKAVKASWTPNTISDPNKALFNNGVEVTASYLVQVLQAENPRFDSERFRKACGI